METYSYKCPVCCFIYRVPAYWMSFSPDDTTEFPHPDPKSDALCECVELNYIGEE